MTEIYKNTVSLPTKAQINKDTDTVIKKPENEESGSYENAAEIKEIKFFSDPKTVKKKTQRPMDICFTGGCAPHSDSVCVIG